MANNHGCGITLNENTRALLESGRVIPAGLLWQSEGIDADTIADMLELVGIESGIELPFGDYIDAVKNAFGFDCEGVVLDVDNKDMGEDYDYDTAWGIIDLGEMRSDCVIITGGALPVESTSQFGQCGKCGDWVTFPCCNCIARELG